MKRTPLTQEQISKEWLQYTQNREWHSEGFSKGTRASIHSIAWLIKQIMEEEGVHSLTLPLSGWERACKRIARIFEDLETMLETENKDEAHPIRA